MASILAAAILWRWTNGIWRSNTIQPYIFRFSLREETGFIVTLDWTCVVHGYFAWFCRFWRLQSPRDKQQSWQGEIGAVIIEDKVKIIITMEATKVLKTGWEPRRTTHFSDWTAILGICDRLHNQWWAFTSAVFAPFFCWSSVFTKEKK